MFIEPLRKRRETSGDVYLRPPEVEAKLFELSALPWGELVGRASITSETDPRFVPSECLLHFMRATRAHNAVQGFEALFRVLRERVLRRLPRAEAQSGTTTAITAETIRDDVFGRFVDLVVADRVAYEEKLDFFEIRFDQALKRLTLTARDKAQRQQNRSAPLAVDEDTGELSPEVERAAAAFNQTDKSEFDEPGFRSRYQVAIDALPPMQARIVEMLRLGIPIDSKEKGQATIARALNRSEKTIRNQRDKAFAALRDMLREGEGS